MISGYARQVLPTNTEIQSIVPRTKNITNENMRLFYLDMARFPKDSVPKFCS
jgi:hypothetical protein